MNSIENTLHSSTGHFQIKTYVGRQWALAGVDVWNGGRPEVQGIFGINSIGEDGSEPRADGTSAGVPGSCVVSFGI